MTRVAASLVLALGLSACAVTPAGSPDFKAVGLTGADAERLARHKVLVTGETFPQVFTPYLDTLYPAFITTDAVLHGFHVLLKASLLRLELQMAEDLPKALLHWIEVLDRLKKPVVGPAELWETARQRARKIVAVALRLSDPGQPLPPDLAELAQSEAQRVETARGQFKPEWLGPPDASFDNLDYALFRPTGFYESRENLQRYFRSIAWMQSIPFRVRLDDELMCFVLLSLTVRPTDTETPEANQFNRWGETYRKFLPRGTAPDLVREAWSMPWSDKNLEGATLGTIRGLIQQAPMEEKKNRWLMPARATNWLAPNLSFLIFAPSDLADTPVLAGVGKPGRLPSGMHVAAALGSNSALSGLEPADAELCREARARMAGPDFTREYLRCLSALADGPERDAPNFMRGDAWTHKTLNSAQAGWAQYRHTLALHGAPWVTVFGGFAAPAGFVEPEPEFYSRLGNLAVRLGRDFKETRTSVPDMTKWIRILKDCLSILNSPSGTSDVDKKVVDLLEESYSLQWAFQEAVRSENRATEIELFSARVRAAIAEMESRQIPTWFPARFLIIHEHPELDPLWEELAELCFRLEALAHKQLRGQPWSDSDKGVMKSFGFKLAEIMLFQGDSYWHPRPFAPEVATVASDPATGRYLQAAIGSPRAIYVLYPSDQGEVLCRGAVFPYYEFSSEHPLTDVEWKARLAAPESPTPTILHPLMSSTKTQVPSREK